MIKFLFFFLSFICTASSSNLVTICKLDDQFGGQLFFTAMAYGIAWEHDLSVVIPKETYLHSPNGNLNYETFFYRFVNPSASEILSHNSIDHIHYNASTPYQYLGGNICISKLQTEFWYFRKYQEEIRRLFAIPEEIRKNIEQKYFSILSHPNTVAVHVRLYHPLRCAFHAFLGEDYYRKLMNRFPDDYLFVIFSDRIDWCKRNLANAKPNIVFIEGNNHLTDFFFMSLCKHIIASNSTFSWWAAYLRQDLSGKVLVPSKWFRTQIADRTDMIQRGLYPSDWEVVPVKSFPPPNVDLLRYGTSSVAEID